MSEGQCLIMYWFNGDGSTSPYCTRHPEVWGQDAVNRHMLDILPKVIAVLEAQIIIDQHAKGESPASE